VTEPQYEAIDTARYRNLGLVGNPFRPRLERGDEHLEIETEALAEGHKLLSTIFEAAAAERKRTVWIEKSAKAANTYSVRAQSLAEQTLIRDDDLNILPCYLQLFMMHVGRIRATLGVVAERIATRSFDRTLAELVRTVTKEPDIGLAEWGALGPGEWDEFLAAFDSDALNAVAEHFGECVLERAIITRPGADVREVSLDAEPEEVADSEEEDEFTAKMPPANLDTVTFDACGNMVAAEPDTGEVPAAGLSAVAEYVIAWAGTHLSPVVARGLRAYAARGFGQMSSELKITKAPRKTLAALIKLARMRFDSIVIMYDGFDNWPMVPTELKAQIVTALTEIRLMFGEDGVIVILSGTDQTPDLEEQFSGSARRVVWEFEGLRIYKSANNTVTPDLVQHWLDLAVLPGAEPIVFTDSPLAGLLDEVDGDISRFIPVAAAAVDAAADRGARTVEADDVKLGLGAIEE